MAERWANSFFGDYNTLTGPARKGKRVGGDAGRRAAQNIIFSYIDLIDLLKERAQPVW